MFDQEFNDMVRVLMNEWQIPGVSIYYCPPSGPPSLKVYGEREEGQPVMPNVSVLDWTYNKSGHSVLTVRLDLPWHPSPRPSLRLHWALLCPKRATYKDSRPKFKRFYRSSDLKGLTRETSPYEIYSLINARFKITCYSPSGPWSLERRS